MGSLNKMVKTCPENMVLGGSGLFCVHCELEEKHTWPKKKKVYKQ